MLDRARATSLALLGATAAVGLAIVALALNQGWPLLEGSAIPAAPREDVARARVVPRAARPAPARTAAAHGRVGGKARRVAAATTARTDTPTVTPSGGEEATALVVAEQAPASSPGGASTPKAPPGHGKTPPSPSQPTQAPTAEPPAEPAPSPPPQEPAPPPDPAPEPTQPAAIASEAPAEESNVPPWSHGNGHAYGRDDDEHDGHGHGRGDDGH